MTKPMPYSDSVVQVLIPMPDKPCWPNWRGHWSHRHRAMRAARDAARIVMLARLDYTMPEWDAADIRAVFVFPHRTKFRDEHNCSVALKPVIDGFEDAKLFAGDRRVNVTQVRRVVARPGSPYPNPWEVKLTIERRTRASQRGVDPLGAVQRVLPDPFESDGYVSTREAAEILGITRSSVSKMLADGRLRGEKVDRRWRVSTADLQRVAEHG